MGPSAAISEPENGVERSGSAKSLGNSALSVEFEAEEKRTEAVNQRGLGIDVFGVWLLR